MDIKYKSHPNDLKLKLPLSRLYLVTDQELSQNHNTSLTVELALKGGVDIVQLREYSLTDYLLLEMAKELREITWKYRALLIINNRPDIAVLSQADGVHLGQEDLPVGVVREMLGKEKIIGVSTHHLAQAQKALADGADYIGVGPVFPTQTKRNCVPPVTLDYVREIVSEKLPIPFYCIGGIKLSNVNEVLMTGARYVAVVTGITKALNVEKVASEFKEIIMKYPL